jgi:hypothetical protein
MTSVNSAWDITRFTKGTFCIIADTPVNKGLGMLQMSVAQLIHEIRLTHVSDYPSCLAARGLEEGQL